MNELDDLKAHSKRAIAWEFTGRFAVHGLGFLIYITLARLLQPSDFGLIAMIMVVVGIASVFSDVGLGTALIQRRRALDVHKSSVFYFNVLVGLVFTVATWFSAPLISEFYGHPQLVPLLQVMSFIFLVNALSSVQTTLLRKNLDYASLTRIGVISTLASGVVSISLAVLGAGVWSLVAQSLVSGIVYNLAIWSSSKWHPTLQFSTRALKSLWGFGFRMFLVELLNAVYMRMDSLIIGKLFAPATLGTYQLAKSLNLLAIQYSSGSIMSVLFPVLSKVQKDLPRFQNIVIKGLGVISFVAFLLFGTLHLIADDLVDILLSDKWTRSAEFFKILAISGVAFPVNAILVNILSSRGNSRAFLRMAIIKKCVGFANLGIGFLFGINGFLYGLIIVSAINTAITITVTSREARLGSSQFYIPVIQQLVIAAASLLATSYLSGLAGASSIVEILLECTVYVTIYILLSRILGTAPYRHTLEQVIPAMNNAIGRYRHI